MENRTFYFMNNGRKSCKCQKCGERIAGGSPLFRYFKSEKDAKSMCPKCYNSLNVAEINEGFSVDTNFNAVTTKNHFCDVFIKGENKKAVCAMIMMRFEVNEVTNCGRHGFRLRFYNKANFVSSAIVKKNGLLTEGYDITVKVDGIEVHNSDEVNAITKVWA